MFRITLGTSLAWLVVATLQVDAQGPANAAPSTMARATLARAPRILPGTPPSVFTVIQGNALTATDGSLSNAFVRLRDARIGRIVDTQVTDGAGLFAFRSLDPGIYIVEIVEQDQASVLAASQLLSVGAGEAVSTIVKLPFRTGAFASIFGTSTSAATITSQAAASGVLATQISGAATCDNLQ